MCIWLKYKGFGVELDIDLSKLAKNCFVVFCQVKRICSCWIYYRFLYYQSWYVYHSPQYNWGSQFCLLIMLLVPFDTLYHQSLSNHNKLMLKHKTDGKLCPFHWHFQGCNYRLKQFPEISAESSPRLVYFNIYTLFLYKKLEYPLNLKGFLDFSHFIA